MAAPEADGAFRPGLNGAFEPCLMAEGLQCEGAEVDSAVLFGETSKHDTGDVVDSGGWIPASTLKYSMRPCKGSDSPDKTGRWQAGRSCGVITIGCHSQGVFTGVKPYRFTRRKVSRWLSRGVY